jgi:hypothetical protein
MGRDLARFEGPGSTAGWVSIDDAVMGGRSWSRLRHEAAGHAVFEGVVSLEDGGGFASLRAGPASSFGAPGATAYLLEAQGDGKQYTLALRSGDAFDGVSYQAVLTPPAGAWTVVRLALADFRPTFRGRVVAGAPALDPATVRQVGLLVAGRQAGPFALAVRSLRAA